MPATNSSLLTPGVVGQLTGLMFTARQMVEGLYAGRHRSPRRGHSTEFYDYRPYMPGDEPKRVDWKLYGRTDRLYVRRYRHDAELAMHLLVDRSASMNFAAITAGGRRALPTKWHYAQQLAAALAYLAVRQNDRVSLSFVDDRAEVATPLAGSWPHLQQTITALEQCEPTGPTHATAALNQAHAMLGHSPGGRGLVILISDLLNPSADWLGGLAPFCHDRFDIAALQVLSPNELDVGQLGAMQLIDAETGRRTRTAGTDTRRRYQQAMRDHIAALRRGLGARRIDHHLIRTDHPPGEALRDYLMTRA